MAEQILCPLPGTFYRKPSPDDPAFKEVGDSVAEGDVIEANIRETERELTRSEAPAAVLAAAEARIPGGTFRSVERIEGHGPERTAEFHVKFERDGASYKVVLGPDGTIHRAVRETRGEIEIPLR